MFHYCQIQVALLPFVFYHATTDFCQICPPQCINSCFKCLSQGQWQDSYSTSHIINVFSGEKESDKTGVREEQECYDVHRPHITLTQSSIRSL